MQNFLTPVILNQPTLAEKQRIREWVTWVDAGGPDHEPFSRAMGLCAALSISHVFAAAYPFCTKAIYDNDITDRTIHLNPARIAWARANAAPKETDND